MLPKTTEAGAETSFLQTVSGEESAPRSAEDDARDIKGDKMKRWNTGVCTVLFELTEKLFEVQI